MKEISRMIYKINFAGKECKLLTSRDKKEFGFFEIELPNNITEYFIYLAPNYFSDNELFSFEEENLFFAFPQAEDFLICGINDKDYYFQCYKYSCLEKGEIKFKYSPIFLYKF